MSCHTHTLIHGIRTNETTSGLFYLVRQDKMATETRVNRVVIRVIPVIRVVEKGADPSAEVDKVLIEMVRQ